MDITNKVANFLGDSISEGIGVSSPDNIYLNLLKQEAPLAAVNNYSISGTRIAAQMFPSSDPTYDQYFGSRVDSMEPNADIVVVFGGTNDFGHGDAPLGSFQDRTIYTFYGACRLLMEQLLTQYPTSTIVFMTPLHRVGEENPRGEGYKMADAAPLATYVEIIKEVGAYYSIPVLDLFSLSGMQPNVPAMLNQYCPDGLHPNDAGHILIASRLKGFLNSL